MIIQQESILRSADHLLHDRIVNPPTTPMIKTTLATVAIVIGASGCATSLLKQDPAAAARVSGPAGVLVGSFSYEPSDYTYYSQTIYFKNVETGEIHKLHSQTEFNIFNGKTKNDFETPSSRGGVFALSLPAGKYTFYNYSLYRPVGTYSNYFKAKEDFSVPFEVQPNKTNYVGEIKLQTVIGRNMLGMRVHGGGIWVLSNQSARDLPLLKQENPDLSIDDVVMAIPKTQEKPTPSVVLQSR